MPTPTNRTPVRVARGTYSNLNSSVSDIQEGEICYATDQDKLYVKEGSSLVDASTTDISGKADLAGPTFTGVPAAPTATSGTNTTQIATTAFVLANSAPLASPSFTGTPAAPTATAATNTTQLATTAFVTGAIADLADSAPSTLDTLNELAAALGDDANFSTTVTNSIAGKLPLAGGTLTGDVIFNEAIAIERVKEKVSISTSAVTGAQEFNAKDQSIVFHNADATGNYTINVRGDSSTTLNSLMDIGQVLTGVFITKYGSTAYYPTAVTVDSSTPALVRWSGGAPSSAGTASSVCATTFSVIKTADATFTVLLSQAEYEA